MFSLNCNFDARLENIIRRNIPLTLWFEKNQETMAYFELTKRGCLHFEKNSMAHYDIQVLGRMANAALTYLENYEMDSDESSALAALAIADIYESEKEDLSEKARDLYSIEVEFVEEDKKSIEKVLKFEQNR